MKVGAVSVNSYLDVVNRQGGMHYRTYPMPNILGSEHAGELVALGPGTDSTVAIGSRVSVINAIPCGVCDWCSTGKPNGCPDLDIIGVTVPGAYAEYTVVPATNLRPVPGNVTLEQAAGMNVLGPLAVQQLIEARAEAGMRVLVQAAASPSGVMAAAVARALGLHVVGTTRSPAKVPRLEALGLFDAMVDSSSPSAKDDLEAAAGGHGMDIVVDNMGEPSLWALSLAVLAPLGTVVSSGQKWSGNLSVDMRRLYQMGQRIVGLRASSPQAREQFWTLVENGQVAPVVDSTFPLDRVADAHRRIESGENVGRPVVTVG